MIQLASGEMDRQRDGKGRQDWELRLCRIAYTHTHTQLNAMNWWPRELPGRWLALLSLPSCSCCIKDEQTWTDLVSVFVNTAEIKATVQSRMKTEGESSMAHQW